jgi:polyhydroxyalkanoate synthase
MFVGDDTLATLKQLTAETGVLDGRVMAATFNLLRGKDPEALDLTKVSSGL